MIEVLNTIAANAASVGVRTVLLSFDNESFEKIQEELEAYVNYRTTHKLVPSTIPSNVISFTTQGVVIHLKSE